MKQKLLNLLFFIIFIEGFFTLSLELLSIRQLVSFVGTGTEVLSIIISSVLLPLAFGYHYGGIRYKLKFKKDQSIKIRNLLSKNIFIIVILSSLGFNLLSMNLFFYSIKLPILIELTLFTMIFLAIPSFLLGQTVPLITNYFSKNDISKITGKILFLSTFGSFAGSIITTLVLMRFIGISYTLLTIEIALLSVSIILSKKKLENLFKSILIILLTFTLLEISKEVLNIEYENTYSTTSIIELKKDSNTTERILSINNSYSSMIDNNGRMFIIYEVMNKMLDQYTEKNILIIGAGGFTAGLNNNENIITYVDIDPKLKEITEKKFLKRKINGRFIVKEIRSHLNETNEKYDIIIVDAFTNKNSMPYSLLTREFYILLKDHLNKNGTVITNMIMDIYKRDTFSIRFENTVKSVFKSVVLIPIQEKIDFEYDKEKYIYKNVFFILKEGQKDLGIYTDDKNTNSFDRIKDI